MRIQGHREHRSAGNKQRTVEKAELKHAEMRIHQLSRFRVQGNKFLRKLSHHAPQPLASLVPNYVHRANFYEFVGKKRSLMRGEGETI